MNRERIDNWRDTGEAFMWLVLMFLLVLFCAAGCSRSVKPWKGLSDIKDGASKLPAMSVVHTDAAKELDDAARIITQKSAQVTELVPQLSGHAAAITSAAENVKLWSVRLVEVGAVVKAESKRVAMLEKDRGEALAHINKLEKRIQDLEANRYGMVRTLLGILAVASVAGVVVCAWILRSPWLATGCGVLFAVCVAAIYLLDYAMLIGLGVLVIIFAGAGWVVFKERQAASQIVRTVEKVKLYNYDVSNSIASVAKGVQGSWAKGVVDRVQRAMGVR